MLIPIILIIFTTIFSMLYFHGHKPVQEPNAKVLIKSVASYIRVFGYMENTESFFEQIGISHTFFSQKYKLKLNSELKDNTMVTVDSMELDYELYPEAENITGLQEYRRNRKRPLKYISKLIDKNNMAQLTSSKININISSKMLLYYSGIIYYKSEADGSLLTWQTSPNYKLPVKEDLIIEYYHRKW